MTPKERVAAPLAWREPERVPYCELWVDPEVAARPLGVPRETLDDQLTPQQAHALADVLSMDNPVCVTRPPACANVAGGVGRRRFLGNGQVRWWDALSQLTEIEALLPAARAFAAIHPLEKGAMDIQDVKRRYGGRLCLIGNMEMDILAMSRAVRELGNYPTTENRA